MIFPSPEEDTKLFGLEVRALWVLNNNISADFYLQNDWLL